MNIALIFVILILAGVVTSIVGVARLVARDGYGRIPDRPADAQLPLDIPLYRIR
ncbi:MAG: hypothetical protein KF739_01235 [Cryobacterium sp.]|nr:hypothetical protein [Micrococcales bacterium]MBX3078907.1 hypothetical protein [Cryobacterium sp.]MBX3309040.1 hypothetical protein [Cryobacterium sp.]MCB1281731.1 hypothetical protein [Salinibacterium sp.]HNP15110.1 hypothetical protein [Terrimesophilobacter sp.]